MVLVPRSIATPAPQTSDLTIRAADGYPLGGTLFEPGGPALGTILLHGATATPQRYYRRFASFAAERGYRVITYDYRGVGASRPLRLRQLQATMTDWARRDARAVIDRVRFEYPGPLYSIGHSFGGQLVGLIDQAHQVDGAIMVGAQLGYYGHWPLARQPRLLATWYGLVPVATTLLGYMPGRIGLGVDLPAGVAREWARWCRTRGYLSAFHDDAAQRFARFSAPTRFYSFTDDEMAPVGAVDALLELLTGADVDHRRLSPADAGTDRIGHFGFFRSEHADTLWSEALAYFADLRTRPLRLVPEPAREPAAEPDPDPDPPLWSISLEEIMEELELGS